MFKFRHVLFTLIAYVRKKYIVRAENMKSNKWTTVEKK